jgi:acyl carrier protein
MRLIAALETEFDIMLETDDVLDLSSFAKGLDILGKYGVSV